MKVLNTGRKDEGGTRPRITENGWEKRFFQAWGSESRGKEKNECFRPAPSGGPEWG